MTNKSDGSTAEYTGGKVNYYEVEITHPTREGRDPYIAECNDIIEALGLSFSEGEAFKAIWRKGAARIKPGKRGHDGGLYDAEKASFYGQRMETIERFNIGKPSAAMPSDFGQQHTIEPASLIGDESPRMQAIGQNVNGGEHYTSTQTNWPDWSTHRVVRINSELSGSQFAQVCNGAYLSVKGKAFNMNRWRVVEQRP